MASCKTKTSLRIIFVVVGPPGVVDVVVDDDVVLSLLFLEDGGSIHPL